MSTGHGQVTGKGVTQAVWLVSWGEYSDYRVLAAFDTRQHAEDAAAAINNAPEWTWQQGAYVEVAPFFDRVPQVEELTPLNGATVPSADA